MSTNDFDQTTPLPVGDDETKPLPSFADAPIEDQKTSAEAHTNTEAEAPDTSTALPRYFRSLDRRGGRVDARLYPGLGTHI